MAKQKPRPERGRGFYGNKSNRLPAFAFGCFKRINFCFGFVGFNGHVGGQVAIAVFPLNRGIRAGAAVPTTRKLGTPFTAVALFDDLMADAAIVGAAFRRHKSALRAFFNSCAIHWNHPLPALSRCKKNTWLSLSKIYASLEQHKNGQYNVQRFACQYKFKK